MNPNEINPATPADPAAPVAPVVPQGNDEPQVPPAPSQVTPPAPVTPAPKTFTKRQRLEHAKEKIESQLNELDSEEDDTRPVTVGDLKNMKREEVRETAIELAGSIADEDERNQVIEMLSDRIVPSSDPAKDLEVARAAVNSLRNQRILEEQARKTPPVSHGNAPAAPGITQDVFVPTPEETVFMQPPYNLSKEDIVGARQKAQQAK